MTKEEAIFKGTKDGLLIILDDRREFRLVLDKLKAKLEAARGFFQGAQVIVDTGQRKLSGKQRKALERLINSQTGLKLKGFSMSERSGENPEEEPPASSGETAASMPKAAAEEPLSPWPQGTVSNLPTLILKRNLRCGQRVNFAGHVLVLGDVNPGAEIVAEGNVVVLGALRGLVHAGAAGNQEAFVAAYRLEPSQLRIAGVFTRAPDGENAVPEDRPEIARLRDGLVIIEGAPANPSLALLPRAR
ncbi:MAG: septum site-determining protein MinC [Bacillota bacterium]|jgi:septum site-determining protein MinC|nr:septum site-determining protein MinC [Bacillota bacterium]MDK2881802.1 septum site-determining protein MinC [Bacillota bacterium]MDK2960272.1 septum site-determining protein MinC [Bacillota bacterium]